MSGCLRLHRAGYKVGSSGRILYESKGEEQRLIIASYFVVGIVIFAIVVGVAYRAGKFDRQK